MQSWLHTPRPLFERALAGLVPRALLYITPSTSWIFWVILGMLAIGSFYLIWRKNNFQMNFDLFLATSFVINPLVHDYDLIQLIPILCSKRLRNAMLLISIPGWLVILFAYDWDPAWFVFTLIPLVAVWQIIRGSHRPEQEEVPGLQSHHSGADAASAAQPGLRQSHTQSRPK